MSVATSEAPDTSVDELDAAIGRAVKARRKLAGLSQQQLADKVGIVYQQLQKYEKGAARIPASRLQRVAWALGVPVGAFFDERCPDRDGAGAQVTALIGSDGADASREVLELVRAYVALRDREVRKNLLNLVKSFARSSP